MDFDHVFFTSTCSHSFGDKSKIVLPNVGVHMPYFFHK